MLFSSREKRREEEDEEVWDAGPVMQGLGVEERELEREWTSRNAGHTNTQIRTRMSNLTRGAMVH